MISDIKVSNGELVFGTNDISIVTGENCIKQHIIDLLTTSPSTLFYNEQYGSYFLKYIHSIIDNSDLASLEQEIKVTLSRDTRIVPNSISVLFDTSKELTVNITCTLVESLEEITVNYSISDSIE